MPFRLPRALQTPDDSRATRFLRQFYGQPYLTPPCPISAYFDTWALIGQGGVK